MSSRISEIILVVLLVVLAGFIRIYYGAPASGPMFVWKSEFGFKDTVVNTSDVLKLPKEQLMREHSQVLDQLEDMGLIDMSVPEKIVHQKRQPVDRFGSVQQTKVRTPPVARTLGGTNVDPVKPTLEVSGDQGKNPVGPVSSGHPEQ